MESNCGLSINVGSNPKLNTLLCSLALGGMYDLNANEFTEQGKKDVENYLNFVEEYHKFITLEPRFGFNLVNDIFPKRIFFLWRINCCERELKELSNYKYFLATALYGLPSYTIVVSGDPNTVIEKYSGEIIADPNADKYVEGKSIVYYVKLFNSALINTASLVQKVIVRIN